MTDTADRNALLPEEASESGAATHPQAGGFNATRLAHIVQARRALPGPGYLAVLIWIHQTFKPATYVEIGVQNGDSMFAAHPEIVRIGIDPAPTPNKPLPGARLFTMTSDEFFANCSLTEELGQDHFDLAFIDGSHLFEQGLLDFINLERFAGPDSAIILHDCLPLDAATSARTRTTDFYSGDVWKMALCLRQQRPDLRMMTIPTPPTGLCIVTGLDRHSTVLQRSYADSVARYMDMTFDDYTSWSWQMPPQIANRKVSITAYVASLRQGAARQAADTEAY
jgi:hypothetical protein